MEQNDCKSSMKRSKGDKQAEALMPEPTLEEGSRASVTR